MREEEKLYPEIENWLREYLREKYKGFSVKTTFETSKQNLDVVLKKLGIECEEAKELNIKIDIVGILMKDSDIKFVFIEVKDTELTLKDLGQLWGYTQLIDPLESFLVSPKGFGRISKIFNVLKREDILRYGLKNNKFMKIARWNKITKSVDWATIIPKI